MQAQINTVDAALPAGLALKVATLQSLLARIAAGHSPATLASSLSIEDMVVTDAILSRRPPDACMPTRWRWSTPSGRNTITQ